MAVGEHRAVYPDVANMMMLKVGTGVGSGLIAYGQIHRGADGAAGDIGHIHLRLPRGYPDDSAEEPICRCGNVGCVEAYAGGWAMARDLRAAGSDVQDRQRRRAMPQKRRHHRRTTAPTRRTHPRLRRRRRGQPLQPQRGRRSAASSAAPRSTYSPACARSSTGARCRWPPAHLQIVRSQLDPRAGLLGSPCCFPTRSSRSNASARSRRD